MQPVMQLLWVGEIFWGLLGSDGSIQKVVCLTRRGQASSQCLKCHGRTNPAQRLHTRCEPVARPRQAVNIISDEKIMLEREVTPD